MVQHTKYNATNKHPMHDVELSVCILCVIPVHIVTTYQDMAVCEWLDVLLLDEIRPCYRGNRREGKTTSLLVSLCLETQNWCMVN